MFEPSDPKVAWIGIHVTEEFRNGIAADPAIVVREILEDQLTRMFREKGAELDRITSVTWLTMQEINSPFHKWHILYRDYMRPIDWAVVAIAISKPTSERQPLDLQSPRLSD